MKSNELRLGNLLKEGRVIRIQELVAQVSQGEKNILADYGSLHGIPLDEEWLLKFGFLHDGRGYFSHPKENFRLYYNQDGQYFECYKYVPANDETGDFKILRHVHKLQNLFYEVYDEELTLKEPAV